MLWFKKKFSDGNWGGDRGVHSHPPFFENRTSPFKVEDRPWMREICEVVYGRSCHRFGF